MITPINLPRPCESDIPKRESDFSRKKSLTSLTFLLFPATGTDSRVGVGFRLGNHADFQVLLELGPQTETDPIGNADSKRRRDVSGNGFTLFPSKVSTDGF